jgi:hypothetical protein
VVEEDIEMKKRIVWLSALLLSPMMVAYASPAHADAGVSIQLPGFGLSVGPAGVGLNIGLPWVVAPAPGPAPAYAYPDNAYESAVTDEPYQPVVAEVAPEFVLPPELGFYVAVGVPYDLFYYNNSYWINRGNLWYNSAYYNGPWTQIYYSNIPYVFNRFPFERIRHYRDSYYGRYQRYGAWEGYNHFRPGHRDIYRGGYDRNRRDYARPHNPDQTYRNRSDVRRPDSSRQGTGNGYTATRPTSPSRGYRDSLAYTRSYSNGRVNAARPAYNRTNGSGQRYGSRPAYIRPNSNRHYYGNGSSYTRQYVTGQGYGSRAAYSRTTNGRQAVMGSHVSTRPNSYAQGSMGRRSAGHTPNGSGNVTRGWQGQAR